MGDVRFIPPEVELSDPWHYRQKLALNENGERFRQYLTCSGGCGFLIGCGDAVESITHNSCLERAEGSTMPSDHGVTLGLGAAEHCAECGAVIDERAGDGRG